MNFKKTLQIAGAALLLLSPVTTVSPVQAQSIQLGGGDQLVADILAQNGFTDGKIVKRGLTITRAEACRNGEKFLIKISILGRITSTTKLGTCRTAFNAQQALRYLQKQGYSQIEARPQGNRVVATACNQGDKFEILFGRRGKVRSKTPIGRCARRGLKPAEIARQLVQDGYTRIRFTDSELPRYVAEACRGEDRLELVLNRRGEIRSRNRIGPCRNQINPRNLAQILENEGFSSIEIVENRRPPFIATACRDNNRVELTIGRFGRIQKERNLGNCRRPVQSSDIPALIGNAGYSRVRMLRANRTPYLAEACRDGGLFELTVGHFGKIRKEERVGRCANPLTQKQVFGKLRDAGYLNITLNRRNSGNWEAEACKEEVKVALRVSAFGEFGRTQQVGSCKSATVLDVLTTLEGRGAEQTRVIIEGCYQGRKYHWFYNRLGERRGRQAVGSC